MKNPKNKTIKRSGVVLPVSRRAPRRTFTIIEKHGGIPYTCLWTSLDGRLCSKHFSTLPELLNQGRFLKALGREPVLLLTINECEIGKAHGG